MNDVSWSLNSYGHQNENRDVNQIVWIRKLFELKTSIEKSEL